MTAATGSAAVWHDVECGGYAADLALWSQLAAEAAGPVLELGCGTGRVALRLAAEGHQVTALDHTAELLDELRLRAARRDLTLHAVQADARDFELEQSFALICAPMQLAHLFGTGERRSMLLAIAAHLRAGGRAAIALLAEAAVSDVQAPPPFPDVAENEGWVYSSQPVEVRAVPGGLEVRRLRQLVSPSGELSSEVDAVRLDDLEPETLATEAHDAGLAELERFEVPATRDHVGSIVCVLEAS